MKKIGIFDLDFAREFRNDFYRGCEQIFDEAYLTNHTFTRQFETDFAIFNQSPYSLAVNSGTAALELALRACQVNGKQVIIPTNTFIATAVACQNAGASVQLTDIENEYFSMCPKSLARLISPHTGAVIVVHIGGHTARYIEEITALCRQYNIPLIEDCAHAHGATFKGKTTGNWGRFGCFSHFMTKVMTTGEGGSVVCQSPQDYELLVSIRQFGKDPQNSISHIRSGSNFKISEFQSLLGVLELRRIQERIEKRRQLAYCYQKNLSSWPLTKDSPISQGTYYKQIVIPPYPREQIVKVLSQHQIPLTGGVYDIPLHRQPVLKKQFDDSSFPIANQFCEKHICPPCYPELAIEDIEHICHILKGIG